MFLKTEMASAWERPCIARPLTASTSSPNARKERKRGLVDSGASRPQLTRNAQKQEMTYLWSSNSLPHILYLSCNNLSTLFYWINPLVLEDTTKSHHLRECMCQFLHLLYLLVVSLLHVALMAGTVVRKRSHLCSLLLYLLCRDLAPARKKKDAFALIVSRSLYAYVAISGGIARTRGRSIYGSDFSVSFCPFPTHSRDENLREGRPWHGGSHWWQHAICVHAY